jgi:pimeloyl-ACP methyl ester carboxylesterase
MQQLPTGGEPVHHAACEPRRDEMSEQRESARVNGIDLSYELRGDGPPLVLLHGFGGTGADFRHVFDLDGLAREHRLILPDLRGHGRTTPLSEPLRIRDCARDVEALLGALGIARCKAVGLSLGAKTLLHVATRSPSILEAMVIVSATPRFPDEARALMRAAAAMDHTEADWAEMRARHRHGDAQILALWRQPAAFAASHDDMAFEAKELAAIEARTLVVHGDRDPLYPVELALELQRGIPSSALWVVPGGGHLPVFERWREPFAVAAQAFLDGALPA